MSSAYLPNFSYLFVPFTTKKHELFSDFYNSISNNGWHPLNINNRYLHRYVVEKSHINSISNATRFLLDKDFAAAQGVPIESAVYSTQEHEYNGKEKQKFYFTIDSVELFVFDTSICILAFKLCFEKTDPFAIASAQYFLRKISTEKIFCNDTATNQEGESFVGLSEKLLSSASENIPLDFFFYAAANNEKANFLTYIDVPQQKDYHKELFFLKWCYNDNFDYYDDCNEGDSEIYQANPNVFWGISASAAVCLVNKSEARAPFIENVFQNNFQKHYLMTYILLLHQKYMMYLFLTKMSVGLEGNLEQLKQYKEMLYDFESHYMFSYISEIPQYQRFYSKTRKLFSLDALFRDVQEPLMQLMEIKNRQDEEAQRRREQQISTSLSALSLLTIVSALTDATGITSNLGWIIPESIARYIQLSLFGTVFLFSVFTLVRLLFSKKD